jgi:hypothetical protein
MKKRKKNIACIFEISIQEAISLLIAMKKPILVIISLIFSFHFGAKAQLIERVDEDRGYQNLRLGMDLSTDFYLDKFINRGLYLEPKSRFTHYMQCEVLGVRIYHSNYQVQELVIFIKPQYDKTLKENLLALYGKPSAFQEEGALVRATWKGSRVTLQVEFEHESVEAEDAQYQNAIALKISYNQAMKITSSF